MKMKHLLKAIALTLALTATCATSLSAQTTQEQQEKQQSGGVLSKIFGQGSKKKNAQKKNAPSKSSTQASERLEPDDTNNLPPGVPAEAQAGRRGQASEDEAAILPYYNMFLTSYHI